MIGLDTNILVRYITQDEPAQSAAATRLLEKACSEESPGHINLIVLCELVWVLEDVYHYDKTQIAGTLEHLLRSRELRVQNSERAWAAWRGYRDGKADFADVLIAAINAAEGCDVTVTFDKKASTAAGFKLLA